MRLLPGSVLISELFLIYTNDIKNGLVSTISQVVDDEKVIFRALTNKDFDVIQRDMDKTTQ